MSRIIRLSNKVAIEFLDTITIPVQTSGLYLYEYQNKQILNNDKFEYNNRNMSFSNDLNKTLLRTTPYPYVSEEQHKAFDKTKEFADLFLNYYRCKVLFAAGFDFTKEEWGIASSIFVMLDNGKKLYLNSFYDEKTESKITPISQYVIVENTTFNQGFEIYVLDCFSIANSTDPALDKLKQLLFDGTSIISEYKIEFSFIENGEVIDFVENDKPFKKLAPTDTYVQYFQKENSEIFNSIKVNSDNTVFLQMSHTAYNLEAYFKRVCGNDGELFSIKHQLDLQAFDINGNNLRTLSTTYQNTENSFNGVTVRPYMEESVFTNNAVDHVLLVLTSYFTDTNSGTSLSRRTSKVIEDTSIFFNKQFKLELQKINVVNKIEKIENRVNVHSDIPNVIQVPVNYFYSQVNDGVITLTPFNNTVKIAVPENITDQLYLCIGVNKYSQVNKDTGYVYFNIPGLEYYKKEKKYYIINESNQTVSYGKIKLQ